MTEPKPQSLPPPLPFQTSVMPRQRAKGKPFSIISIVIAGMGIIPVLIFFWSCLTARNWAGRSAVDLSHFAFFFVGIAIHGIGLGSGIVGVFMKSRDMGIFGIVGNAIILLMAIFSLLLACSHGVL